MDNQTHSKVQVKLIMIMYDALALPLNADAPAHDYSDVALPPVLHLLVLHCNRGCTPRPGLFSLFPTRQSAQVDFLAETFITQVSCAAMMCCPSDAVCQQNSPLHVLARAIAQLLGMYGA
jgi:hypothetical protein